MKRTIKIHRHFTRTGIVAGLLFAVPFLVVSISGVVFGGNGARDLGIPLEGLPGKLNAVTDVKGVEVGHVTILSGEGKLKVGKGPVRTGVTAILPRGKFYSPVFAGISVLNGNGEMTGSIWVKESGILEGPIAITNTHSVGVVRDSIIAWQVAKGFYNVEEGLAALPVVGETYDGYLNDMNGFHVKKEHVFAALDNASSGSPAEGSVGGGTGMVCHQFKGGIGTSSRVLPESEGGYTVGVLVQANQGKRGTLMVAGVPVGKEITDLMPILHEERPPTKNSSIIVVIATDAPLLSHQLERVARRASLGIALVGGKAEDGSGEIMLAFSTANPESAKTNGLINLQMLSNDRLNPLFEATVQATEEAILNALANGRKMVGINGNTIFPMPPDRLREVLRKYNRSAY